jgi:hypothetical protein
MVSSGKLCSVAIVGVEFRRNVAAVDGGAAFLRNVVARRSLVEVSVVPSSPILVTLMKEALSSSETSRVGC